MNKFLRFFTCILFLSLTSGCSSLQGDSTSLLRLALTKQKDVEFSLTEVQAFPWDMIYVRLGKQARASMVLAYLEYDQFKWVSSDNAMLILEEGRIVRTIGFPNDLLHVSDTSNDPIRFQNLSSSKTEWLRLTDWAMDNYSGYQLSSTFEKLPPVDLVFFDRPISTQRVRESATFTNTGQQVENLFWFDAESGQLIQSRQQLGPDWPVIEIIHISQIARLLKP